MMAAKHFYQSEGRCLRELLEGIVQADEQDLDEVLVLGLSTDSRRIGPGDLFLACGGKTTQGHAYINDAIKYGACAVLFESSVLGWSLPSESSVPIIGIDGLASKVGVLADRFYNSPSKELIITGVTGTNGKTSCSHIIAQALCKATSTPAGVMGTLGYGLCGSLEKASHTTPDSITVHRLLRDMKKRGAQDVVMEVSSHGLDQGRTVGVDFNVAVFTNITRDHLDYHQTMQAYVDAKKRLFALPNLKCAVINLNDAYCEEVMSVISSSCQVIGYSVNPLGGDVRRCIAKADSVVYGTIVKSTMAGSEVFVESKWGSATFTTLLLGEFNVSNLLAALSVLLWRGLSFDDAIARLATVRPLVGRMEVIARSPRTPIVVIDYAHTPDALKKVIKALKQLSSRPIWCIFGCGGDRDQGKRSQMGSIAEQLADKLVLTDDNPRSESPESIVEAILSGMTNPNHAQVIHNREQAIQHVLKVAAPEDIVLIAGKGHEDYQEIKGVRRFFSDHAVVLSVLAQRASS